MLHDQREFSLRFHFDYFLGWLNSFRGCVIGDITGSAFDRFPPKDLVFFVLPSLFLQKFPCVRFLHLDGVFLLVSFDCSKALDVARFLGVGCFPPPPPFLAVVHFMWRDWV
jgi:hypothetical protein